VSLGEPLHIFTISLEQVRAYQEGTDIGEVLADTGQLSYPVLMDGEVVSSITVGKQDDQWKFVSLGNPNLTKGLAEARQSRAARRGPEGSYRVLRQHSGSLRHIRRTSRRRRQSPVHPRSRRGATSRRRPHAVVPHATEPGEDVVRRLQAQLPAAGPGAAPRPRGIPF